MEHTGLKPGNWKKILAKRSTELLLFIAGALLAACTGPVSDSQNNVLPASLPPFDFQLNPDRNFEPPNLDLIGVTGRPQFYNAYAEW